MEVHMEETVKQEVATEERTFTQDELNAIVSDRLKRAESKYEDYEELKAKAEKLDKIEEENKSELERATERAQALEAELDGIKKANEVRDIRQKVAEETGVPVSLITGDTEEECKAQAEAINAYAKPTGYPAVKDGGEVHQVTKRSTRDQFAEWAGAILN